MRQKILIRFPDPPDSLPYILDLGKIPSEKLGDHPQEKPVIFDLKVYFHPIEQFWFIGYNLSRAGSRQFDFVEPGVAQAYAHRFGKALPSVPAPTMTDSKPARQVQRTKKSVRPQTLAERAAEFRLKNPRKRNVPSMMELIDRKTRNTWDPVRITFDDIREKCHDEKDVSDSAVEKTIYVTKKAIARLPYRLSKDGYDAVIQKIPPQPRPRKF
jgi:hypothetical protein